MMPLNRKANKFYTRVNFSRVNKGDMGEHGSEYF